MSGWIKLHRATQDSAIASHPEYLAVWVHLLLRAQYSASQCVMGRSVVRLEAGQLVFGRIKFAAQVGISEAKVRAALDVMKSLNMITIKSMAKFSIISITNWKTYQDDNQQIAAEQPASSQQATSNEPASGHIQESKEVKESKEIKNIKNPLPENKFSEEDLKCSLWLAEKLCEFIPDCKKPNVNGWAEHVRKMRELDNRDHKEICQLWLWCRKDSFEAANVQSPEKLRKRYDQLKAKMKLGVANGSHQQPYQQRSQQNGLAHDDTSWADELFGTGQEPSCGADQQSVQVIEGDFSRLGSGDQRS